MTYNDKVLLYIIIVGIILPWPMFNVLLYAKTGNTPTRSSSFYAERKFVSHFETTYEEIVSTLMSINGFMWPWKVQNEL